MFTFSFSYVSKVVKLFSECCFSWKRMNEMFVILFEQILMNVKNCLDFAKEENVLIHLVASSVSVRRDTIWMKRLECVMVCSLCLTSLLLLFLENNDSSKRGRIHLSLKRVITRPSSVKLMGGKTEISWILHWEREKFFFTMLNICKF